MATYYVDGNSGNDSSNGSTGSPWKTLRKARTQVKPGDEVRIRSATYHEMLTIETPNTAWRADTGHKPVLDGRFHEGLMVNGKMPLAGPNHLPTGGIYANMVTIRSNGVVLDGLTVQNCAGSGIGVGDADDIVIRNCRVDFSQMANIKVNAGSGWADRVVIENNVLTRAALAFTTPELRYWSGSIVVGRGRDSIVRNNVVAYSYGEGIDVHRGSLRVLVEGNVVHSCLQAHIYIQRASGNVIRNNLVFHTGASTFIRNSGFASEGLAIADERSSNAFPASTDNELYNNIVINCGWLFCFWSNTGNLDNSRLVRTYIGYNTFVGGPYTRTGINISANQRGNPHANNIFENNIITNIPGGVPISTASGNISGVLFRNNLWSSQPITAMRGNGDRIGNPALVNPTISISDVYPSPHATVEPRNYQLTSNSNLALGMASNGSAANGLTPPTIQKDFFGVARDSSPDIGAHEYAGVTIVLTANFSIGPGQASGPLPHTVDFTDKSTSERTIVSRQWDFGDGETSTETNPSHTYNKAGMFDVTLTVTDESGESSTVKREGLISVAEVPNVVLPNSFRRFVLIGAGGDIVLAHGTQFPDLRCILVWNTDPFHILNFDTIEDVNRSYVETEKGTIMWIDPSDQEGPPVVEPVPDPGTHEELLLAGYNR